MYFRSTFDPIAKEVTEEVQLKLVYLYCMIVQFTSVEQGTEGTKE